MTKRNSLTFALGLALLLSLSMRGAAQKQPTSLEATARGEGRLVVGRDEAKISAVVVVLRKNGDAEITLITVAQVLVRGKWSGGDPDKGIGLEITGGDVSGNAKGTGMLFLDKEGKKIVKLTMRGETTTGTKFEAEFVAEKADPAPR
ncbi:MAG: hypothetical protein ACRD68_14390 [Pyrinomonadaceae bacterium]